MAQVFNHVERGDLITAKQFNNILDKLFEMETRIEDLESSPGPGSRVTIDHFFPKNQQHIDRTLEIYGTNFEIPPEKNTVTVNDVPVVVFGLSTVTLLRIKICQVDGAPDNMHITVSNVNGSVTKLYRVLEKVPVSGDPPIISTITHGDGNLTLKVGEGVIINGSNFAATPSENNLRLKSRESGHENDIFDITDINSANSDTSQIQATLPSNITLVKAPLFPGGPIRPDNMEIELTVGAFDSVFKDVQVEE